MCALMCGGSAAPKACGEPSVSDFCAGGVGGGGGSVAELGEWDYGAAGLYSS